ncbi:MAG TPA: HTTM domain-containing protein [Methylomirabilota bacterium]|nr:HTTM domain-containing protein [Methylomirabilota bacterium]
MPRANGGWFDPVPAYRIATLRVCLAVVTLVFHVPKFNGLLDAYTASAFHVAPAFAWIPMPGRGAGLALMGLQHVAAWALFLGWWPRLAAWTLTGAGAYIMALDGEHYSHNAHFHLTLLALVGCAADGVSLRRLVLGADDDARAAAWPERLIRLQLAIVFFFAALDKVLSPHWRMTGAVLTAPGFAAHAMGLAALQRVNQVVLGAVPGVLSLATIATELALAAGFALPALAALAIVLSVGFMTYLEFMVRPGVFTWDVLITLLLLSPAADRGWRVVHAARGLRPLLARLDWMRRLQWVVPILPSSRSTRTVEPAKASGGLHLVSPRGRVFCGLAAVCALPAALPGPLLVGLVLARFGGGFLAARGLGRWDDLPFLALGAYLACRLIVTARAAAGRRDSSPSDGCAHANAGQILDPSRGRR